MNLRTVDLNLLVAFDALLRTRHVTRAARLVGVGQPGMSAALARLRQLFGDDLLVKQGAGMVPTSRALALEPAVRRLLRDVERLVGDAEDFDPAVSDRTFRLRLSDLLSFLILPDLIARLSVDAPGLDLEVEHLSPEATVDALARDDIDLAVSTNLTIPKTVEYRPLFQDRALCVAREGHPALRRLDNVEGFIAVKQVNVSQSPLDDRFVDRQLAELGLHRDVALTVPHWLAVAEVVARTDLVAVMPASIGQRMAINYAIQTLPLPLEGGGFEWGLYWHKRHSTDGGHEWLRRAIGSVCQSL